MGELTNPAVDDQQSNTALLLSQVQAALPPLQKTPSIINKTQAQAQAQAPVPSTKATPSTPNLPPVPGPNMGSIMAAFLPSMPAFLLSLFGAQVLYSACYYDQSSLMEQAKEVMAVMTGNQLVNLQVAAKIAPLVMMLVWYLMQQPEVYLVDFAVFKAPASWRITQREALDIVGNTGRYNESSMAFQEQIIMNSGMGPATAVPPAHHSLLKGETPDKSIEATRKEAHAVLYPVIEEVLDRAGLTPQDIDILVVNCTLFVPTPSLSAMIASRFQMRSDLTHFTLGGMGCSAGLISLDLAQKLLKQQPNSRALVLSTELITQALYPGNDRAFLVQNMLFRSGASCVLLSNRPRDAYRAQFKLKHLVRALGTDPTSFETVYNTEDAEGNVGVRLSRHIAKVAGRLLQVNLNTMGPKILPLTELTKSVVTTGLRRVTNTTRSLAKSQGWSQLAAAVPEVAPYHPKFPVAVDHFCVHAGGRAITDGVQKGLSLTSKMMEPSVATFDKVGNVSSSSVWYELDHIREHCGLKKGDRILQIAFGGGFKCNTAYWEAL